MEEGRPQLTHQPSPSHGGRWVISGAFLGAGEQGLIPSVLSHVSPVTQARDANQLDDVDPYLTEKYKEEHEEAERVVRPVKRAENEKSHKGLRAQSSAFSLARTPSSLGARTEGARVDRAPGVSHTVHEDRDTQTPP